MRRIFRRIVNWAYGYDFSLRTHLLEERQRNLAIILEDYIKAEKAKKDLALTWEDMQLIWQIFDTMNDECKGKKPGWMFGSKSFFNEALKRFKEAKK